MAPLYLLGVGPYSDVHAHRFHAAAGAQPAYRRRREVIASDREAQVTVAREDPVGDVDAHPSLALDPDIGPCVARRRLVVAGIDVAAHVARRHPRGAAAGDEEVGVVLAYAAPDLE